MSAEAGVSEDLTEVGLPAEVDNEGFFKKLWVLESGQPSIVSDNKGARVGGTWWHGAEEGQGKSVW